jgi:hypothetical protein
MVAIIITVICVIALIAIILWFVNSVGIAPPLLYVVYAGIAIVAILCIVWIMDRFGGGFASLH